MGEDSYDGELSERRACAVMNYLVLRGVPFRMIVAEGRGKDAPVKTGCDSTDRRALIACLAPNRRVWAEMKSVG
jgi:OOP family OmpA-OmpF porin